MRKLIAAINMTLDGFCNHDAVGADAETHAHYSDLLRNVGGLIYGRTTYQLMESYWPTVVANPTGTKPTDDFAVLIDNLPKIVYSRTLQGVSWKNSTLKKEIVPQEILELKRQPGKPLCAGSPSMIVALTELDLIDEYQLCIHPVILGSGLQLFQNISHRTDLKLQKTKTFGCGAVVLYLEAQRA